MNFFSRNDIGDRTGGNFRGNGYWLGQTGTTRKSVIGRMSALIDMLGESYTRNADLPLQYRVPGAVYASVAATGDALAKQYIFPFNQNPSSPVWDQPADQTMKNAEDSFNKQVFDFGDKVTAQEKTYHDALRAGEYEPEGPQLPEDISTEPGGATPKPTNMLPIYIGLGVVALAAIVGATLMSPAPQATSGPVETIPSEPAPAEERE